LFGFTQALAIEGRSKNVQVNAIAPIVGSRMTETTLPADILDKIKPEYVSPMIGDLAVP